MKKKIFSVLFSLVLVLSLSLVTAVPAGANGEPDPSAAVEFGTPRTGDTATWETDKNASGITGYDVALGSYSVKLTKVNPDIDGPVYLEFVPESGITMADLATFGTTGFWYYFPDSGSNCGPNLELLFTIPEGYVAPVSGDLYDPSDGKGFAQIAIAPLHSQIDSGISLVKDAWTELVVGDASCAFYKVLTPNGVETYDEPSILALDEILAAINGEANMISEDATADTWELTRVRVNLWEPRGPTWSSYIDDITINGVTYDLEPIALEKDYYRTGESIEVTVYNGFANTDPIRVNPYGEEVGEENYVVKAISNSDSIGITVDLQETLMNSGVFQATFVTTDQLPAPEDKLYVQDGDTIIVTCGTATTGSDWGAGEQADVFDTATVDITAPTVEIAVPDDLINVADDSGSFDVICTFSETMDTLVTPTIAFDPEVVASGTLAFSEGVWSTATYTDDTYTATYDVDATVSEEVADVGASVSGAKDPAGNLQDPDPTAEADAFDVDTIAPTLISIDWNDADDSAEVSAGDILTFTFSEAIETSTITAANINDRLVTLGSNSYGTLTSANLVWNDPTNNILTLAIGEGVTVAAAETVDPANEVVDLAGNPDATADPGPSIAKVALSIDAPARVLPAVEDFAVQVDISQVEDFDVASFDVSYEPTVLTFLNVIDGDINGTSVPVDDYLVAVDAETLEIGTVSIIVNVAGYEGATGSGYLCELHFASVGISGESSAIGLDNAVLGDTEERPIVANAFGATVELYSGVTGDANGDGDVTMQDVTRVEKIILGLADSPPEADANEDSSVDVRDITRIEKIILGVE